MSVLADAGLVAAKDLRIEARSRVTLAQVLPFGIIVLLLFAFALDPDRGRLAAVAPGLFWVAVMLAALLAIGRSFAIEQLHGARDGLRLSGIDGAAVFLGKAAAIAAQLAVLEVLLGLGVAALYGVDVTSVVVLVAAGMAATAGLAATGTLFGVLAAGLRLRETLLPLLLLPVITPVMLGATRAFESGLGGDPAEGWPWIALLGAFAGLYLAVGVLAFGSLWEDA
ncbi:MAG TPA: heme exporter protein CcmB [Acidimicrobiia bacterium]|nr:heme exporter protein CcmB [Acidimicrobiia bacterium]